MEWKQVYLASILVHEDAFVPPTPPVVPLALRRQQTPFKSVGWLMGVAGALLIVAVPLLMFLFA